MEILLIEDNRRLSEFVVKGLEESGFGVVLAETGTDARRLIADKKWDVILLDIMLPDIDGFELLQYTRFKENHTPILVLSALNDTDDKVKALEYGADDYLSKPFHFKELIARIHALTRRFKQNYNELSTVLMCDDLKVYVDEHRVVRGEKEIKLTFQEFKLLKYLMEHKNRIMSRTQILDAVWG
ncbi:MAG: response regulator transcription factor, partial [Bacteroidales bacterium]|nr:response regulator transcription factor [Bacteroidales bacterium]